jgi:VWFA-related protein
MVQGKNVILTAALVLAASAVTVAPAQQQASNQLPQAPASQQQAIPDAPHSQTLPDLKTITPIGPAIAPDAESTSNQPADGQKAPGSTLPSTPAAPAQPDDPDQGPPPDLGAKAFVLPSVQVNFVEVPFTVKDSKGQLVPGITYRDVRVYENNVRQHMATFTTDPFPLSVAIVIDQSVTFDTMTKVNNALGALQGAFTPYDEVAVFTYNNGVKEQTPFTGAQSARLGVILERSKGVGNEPLMPLGGPLSQGINLNGSQIDSNTSGHPNNQSAFETAPKQFHTLNDAILAAATVTSHAGRGRRRIVYVISDGKEYGSKAKEKEVINYCLTNNVSVWATLVGDPSIYGMGFLDRIHIPLTMRDNVLPRYTTATAGQIDSEFRQRGIEASFQQIAAQARNQYTIGYYSKENLLDGKYRKLDVRILRSNLQVIAKDGYWPRPNVSYPPATPAPTAIP